MPRIVGAPRGSKGNGVQVRVSPEIGSLLDEAAAISVRLGKYYVGVEHLFEALVNSADLLPGPIRDEHLQALRQAAKQCQSEAWRGVAPDVQGQVYYTPRCGAAINESSRLAERFRNQNATGGHALLALLADSHSLPSRVLDRMGPERQAIVEKLRVAFSGNKPLKAGVARPQTAAQAVADESPAADAQGAEGPLPSLDELTRDLTEEAREGRIEPAIGRDAEVMEVIEVLARKGKSSAILVGEAGVGKTKIVEGLALRAAGDRDGGLLAGKRILELNLSALMSGTQYRGAFEQRVGALIKEIENDEKVILFIDEIHLIMGAGSTDGGGMDLANLLKPTLSRGRIKCIGATTLQEYRKFIGKDPAIERRFQMVRVEPLTPEATLRVLDKLRPSLEKHHGVQITRESLKTAIDMTVRYLPNRQLPDKAIDALDQACARYRIHRAAGTKSMRGRERHEVNCHDIRRVVSQLAGVPLEEVTVQERRALVDLDRRLAARIIGQDEAVTKAATAVKKARAGLADPDRPDASMLFLGPTGVGKTQLAKELARSVLGSRNHLITFDMSEFIESHSVSRLIGAPPGYVGSEKEGLLTEAVANNPFSIVLFDEIEKAHPQIFDIFLPILDEGRLKDSQGKMVSFRNTMIIFTSNIGANVLCDPAFDHNIEAVLDELRKHFRPEFINRIDEIVPFYPLLPEDVRSILRQMVDRVRLRLKEKNIGIRMYQRAYEYLGEKGYSPQYGARELQRAVERHIAGPLSEMLLEGKFVSGDMVDVLIEGDGLLFQKGDPSSKQRAGAA